jgi:hypothetical protein
MEKPLLDGVFHGDGRRTSRPKIVVSSKPGAALRARFGVQSTFQCRNAWYHFRQFLDAGGPDGFTGLTGQEDPIQRIQTLVCSPVIFPA